MITCLNFNQIFVFGSNLAGRHGKGAALQAMQFGAIYGQKKGLMGNTYGIPTKSYNLSISLTLEEINVYVKEFIIFAKNNNHLEFLVTEIGCGLAGYKPEDIAPMFKECIDTPNIILPENFIHILS